MADQAITDYDEQTDPHSENLLEVVDLFEAAAADQNKKITFGTMFSMVACHENEIVFYESDIVLNS